MSNVHTHIEQYAGDNALYCHIGKHAYTLDRCIHCGRRNPTNSNTPTVNN